MTQWQLVPKEPTEAMIQNAYAHADLGFCDEPGDPMTPGETWECMLEAAPKTAVITLVGWTWRLSDMDIWQYTDGPEKTDLGLPPSTAARIIWRPVYAIVGGTGK